MSVPELRRSIGIARATAMVVGIIVGASIFVQPSAIAAQLPGSRAILAVWMVAGALTMIGSLVIAELSSAWPSSGGVYVFLRNAYSPAAGFLWGWAMFWSMHSGIVAAIAVVFARYAGGWLSLGDVGTKALAIGAIASLTALNCLGVRQGTAFQTVLTLVKVLAVAMIAVVGLFIAQHVAPSPMAAVGTSASFASALVAGLFAYGGWHMVSYTAGETLDASRTIPRALVMGTITVTILYVAVNAAYLRVLSIEQLRTSTRVVADFADAVAGGSGARIMTTLVVVSSLGAMNGVILAGPRVYLAMANDGLLFRWIGAVHPTFRTPSRALILQGAWSSVLVATGSYKALFTRVVYTEWIFFALLAAALFHLRKRTDYAPAYRTWGYPVAPVVFVLASIWIVVAQIIASPFESLTGLALVLAGLPVYFIWARRGEPSATDFAEMR